ncbi:TIGR01777 family oxidoreductase [Aquirufa ecclesiirivi]|uniref:TIGR01777 family oxidoreductase n=1 Tax=Aquirufa ecclesiirivi TaxID=2715124 RepID=UPI0023D7EFB2|nr:TIGR01777 family oxidoreductase [Aquirufa ecclesiirivi]MDF0692738.1 TIGR01777 family oxidoreductase [Aquirufa ecclesiirivi]
MKILITGGTGFIGKALQKQLRSSGHEVVILSRSGGDFHWDPAKGEMDIRALEGLDAIIHLAGAGIAEKRWTESRKEELIQSRVQSSQTLYQALKQHPHQVHTLISASGIGYYGADTGERLCEESTEPGQDFIASCTQAWEGSLKGIEGLGIRVVKFRIGLVMGNGGGIFPVLQKPIRWFVGANIGTGKQWQSWIHLKDLIGMFQWALQEKSMKGVYNAVAPEPLRQSELNQQLARAMHRPLFLPAVPAFALRLVLGEMAVLVTGGNLVSSDRIQKEAGFSFRFVRFSEALKDLIP